MYCGALRVGTTVYSGVLGASGVGIHDGRTAESRSAYFYVVYIVVPAE